MIGRDGGDGGQIYKRRQSIDVFQVTENEINHYIPNSADQMEQLRSGLQGPAISTQQPEEISARRMEQRKRAERMQILNSFVEESNYALHVPKEASFSSEFAGKFKARVSDRARLSKQSNKKSRLFQKIRNYEKIESIEDDVYEKSRDLMNGFISNDQIPAAPEEMMDIAAFMVEGHESSNTAILKNYLGNGDDREGMDKQKAMDFMLGRLTSFRIESIDLANDTVLCQHADELQRVSMQLRAFESLAAKNGYYAGLDDDTQHSIESKLDEIRSVVTYYEIRKDIIKDPLYKSHYNDELSMDFTATTDEGQKALAKKLLKAHLACMDMLRENGADSKLIAKMQTKLPRYKDRSAGDEFESRMAWSLSKGLEDDDFKKSYNSRKEQQLERIKMADLESQKKSLIDIVSDEEIKSLQNKDQLYSALSGDQWKEKGGATYKKIMEKTEANRIVQKSKGFLTAVKVEGEQGKGYMELKPSLPETVKVKGGVVNLRETWNLLMKTYITLITNEDGSLKYDDKTREIVSRFTAITSMYGSVGCKKKVCERYLKETFVPAMKNILVDNYPKKGFKKADEKATKRADEISKGLILLIENLEGKQLLPNEMDVETHLNSLSDLDKTSDEEMTAHLRKFKIKVPKVVDGKKVIEERYPTEEEISKAISGLREDVAKTAQGLKKVRDLDIDSKVVPIPNTCSGNANFYRRLKNLHTGQKNENL